MAEGFLGLARVFTRSHRPIHSQLLIGKETATTRNCENYQVKTGVAAGAPPSRPGNDQERASPGRYA